jgi:hypothetical protein
MRGVRHCRKALRVGQANLMFQKRDSKDNPRLKAFCRVAPSVLFSDRAIFPAGVFFRASAFKVRTCSDVHGRRFPFSLVIIFPLGYSTRFNNAAGCPRFIQPRQEKNAILVCRGIGRLLHRFRQRRTEARPCCFEKKTGTDRLVTWP